ncbi:tetratricopeptide repeat protein, partial [bacterium]|nr:tetratricopeptide repeat protein [bacterium]
HRARSNDGRLVALKLLSHDREDALARFDREARLLETLGEEDGFVPLLDSGRDGSGSPFVVMPLLTGGTLADRLRKGGALEAAEVCRLGERLARALGKAHALGIVHRDVKPENVLFDESGRAFVGAVLYECLAGQPAFSGLSFLDRIEKVASGEAVPLERVRPETPPVLARIVARALDRDPALRFADGEALARAVGECVHESGRARRARVPLVVALGVLVAVLAAWVHFSGSLRPAAPSSMSTEDETRKRNERWDALELRGELETVIAECTRAIERDPMDARAWRQRGSARLYRRDLDGAIADCSRALELDPKCAMTRAIRGEARLEKGDVDGAVADGSRAIELDPKSAVSWANLGLARFRRGDLEGAISDSSRALELDPKNPHAWAISGHARLKKEDLEGSIGDYSRAIVLNPRMAPAWGNRAFARLKKGDLEEAISDFSRSLELDPKSTAWWGRGLARQKRGDLEGAISDFSLALELDPTSATAWANRAVARVERGDLEGAISDFSRALELDPRSSTAWANRGLARQKKGDLAGARSDLERFLELAPDSHDAPEVRKKLAEIEGR